MHQSLFVYIEKDKTILKLPNTSEKHHSVQFIYNGMVVVYGLDNVLASNTVYYY